MKNEKTAKKFEARKLNSPFIIIFRRIIDISTFFKRQLKSFLKYDKNFTFKSFFDAATAFFIMKKNEFIIMEFNFNSNYIMLWNVSKQK